MAKDLEATVQKHSEKIAVLSQQFTDMSAKIENGNSILLSKVQEMASGVQIALQEIKSDHKDYQKELAEFKTIFAQHQLEAEKVRNRDAEYYRKTFSGKWVETGVKWLIISSAGIILAAIFVQILKQ